MIDAITEQPPLQASPFDYRAKFLAGKNFLINLRELRDACEGGYVDASEKIFVCLYLFAFQNKTKVEFQNLCNTEEKQLNF